MDYPTFLLAIDLWREARNQSHGVKVAKAWVVKNRVAHSGWWGATVVEVITHKWQFTGMTGIGDPNLVKWPQENDPQWADSLAASQEALGSSGPDLTLGATYYYDHPLTEPPEEWGHVVETTQIGSTHFYKEGE